ncbi:leukocidin family pore-forming toxin [uncultured Shewanella sp.]|uniref:leukocidin family pore-forming toxin n=1 Tax=uncultured Shewanella sp. TaxID=173975 RepID=UPI0026318E16|nr:leukocidin family pore-forming toxin [uncultured Shewanella sp.]
MISQRIKIELLLRWFYGLLAFLWVLLSLFLFSLAGQVLAATVMMEQVKSAPPRLLAIGSEKSAFLDLFTTEHQVSHINMENESFDGPLLNQDLLSSQLNSPLNSAFNRIKQADVLFVDFAQAAPIESASFQQLIAYLQQAQKWQKPIFVANGNQQSAHLWPIQFESPMVLIMPQTDQSDVIVIFNDQHEVNQQASTARLPYGASTIYEVQFDKRIAASGSQFSPTQALSANDSDINLSFVQIRAQLKRMLKRPSQGHQVINHRVSALPKVGALSKDSYMNTGGQVGYPCPAKAKIEHLCYSAIVMNDLYLFEQDDAKLNVVHGYSFAAYRTELGTSIFVSPFGSANPTLTHNTDVDRGFFLKQVKPEVKVSASSAAGLMLFKRSPENQNGTDRVSTSSGMGLSLSGAVSNNPSLGATISYSQSRSQMTNLTDWRTTTYSHSGYDANWDYHFNKYIELEDWVVDKLLSKKARLKEVPVISAHGLQYSAEAIWFGSHQKVSGVFEFTVKTTVVNERLYFVKNNLLDWELSSTHFSHGLHAGGERFNTDWLKTL